MSIPYRVDCHVHSQYSPDGHDKVEELAYAAIRQGLRAITITDHCELNPHVLTGDAVGVKKSFQDVQRIREEISGSFQLLAGMELGAVAYDYVLAEQLVSGENFDCILGSVHYVEHNRDLTYSDTTDPEEIGRRITLYWKRVLEMTLWGKIDVVAHLTFPFRYIPGSLRTQMSLSHFQEQIEEVLTSLIEKRIALEINTRYPHLISNDTELLLRYRQMGGKHITFGSDSHSVEGIGYGIKEGMTMAYRAGFRSFCIYVNRQPQWLPLDR